MDGFPYISRFSSRFGWNKQHGFTSALSFWFSKKKQQPKVVVSVSLGQGAEGKLMMSPPKAIKSSKKRRMKKQKQSLKLTVHTWKLMVGRSSFPFGARPSFGSNVRNAFVFSGEKSPRFLGWNGPCHSTAVSFARLKQNFWEAHHVNNVLNETNIPGSSSCESHAGILLNEKF